MKKILISILIFSSLLLTGVIYASSIEINQGSESAKIKLGQSYDLLSPIAWYKLDATTTDEMGNYDGANDGATRDIGKVGGSFRFDVADSVNLGTISELSNTAHFTISFWMNQDSTDILRYIFYTHKDTNNRFYILTSTIGNGAIQISLGNGSNAFSYWSYVDDGYVAGTDAFLTVVYDGTQPTNQTKVNVYMNSELLTFVGDSMNHPTLTPNYGVDSNIGNPLGNSFNGELDDFKMFDYSLSSQQVKDLYNSYSKKEIGQSYDLLNPIAWYKLDADADDEMGNYDGTNNGATRNIGMSGGAFEFDGSDNVNLGNSVAFEFDSTDDFTFSFWVKQDSGNNLRLHYTRFDALEGGIQFFARRVGEGSVIDFLTRVENVSAGCRGISSIRDNVWHHIVGSYSSNDVTKRVYVDGIFEKSCILTAGQQDFLTTSTNAFIGSETIGSIDDFKIYDYTLSSQQVKDLYNSY